MAGAAFYDLDGTLVSTNLVHVFAYYARNDQGILKSVGRSLATLAGLPLFMAADAYSRKVFNDIFFTCCHAPLALAAAVLLSVISHL